MKKAYDSDTKSAYIEQIESGGKSVSEAAKELGITENAFYSWRRRQRNDPRGGQGSVRQKADEEYPRNMGKKNVRQKRYVE